MKLAYQAYDPAGRLRTDTLEASSPEEASEQLRRQGLFVTSVAPVGAVAAAGSPSTATASVRRRFGTAKRLKTLALMTRQLYVLSSTGTPLVESLGALQRQARDPAWQNVISSLRNRVEEGLPLSQAMSEHPQYFDAVYQSLVAAGEAGGNFEPMLDRLAQLVKRQLHVRSSITGSLVYPALLLTVSGVVLTLMLTFVLPRFTTLFDTLDVPLPPTTQLLIILSEAMRSYWWAGILLVIGGVFAVRAWLATPAGRLAIDTALVRLPFIGPIVRSFATARITRLLGTLLENHVSLLEAITLTREAAGNAHYRELLTHAEQAVTRGEPISVAFANESLISPSVYESIRSGEATGQIGPLLLNVAEFLDEDNEVLLRSLTSILEPAILIGLGLLVGLVAISMFMPLFDLTASAGGAG